MRDMANMISLGFIGWDSKWDPLGICIVLPTVDGRIVSPGNPLIKPGEYLDRRPARMKEAFNPPYKMDTWRKEVPIDYLNKIVEKFVDMYCEEYAIPLAKSIERGLKKFTDRYLEISGNYWNNTGVEVSIIKRSY